MSQTQVLEPQIQANITEIQEINGRIKAIDSEFNGIVDKIHNGVLLEEHERLNSRLEELLATLRTLVNRRAKL